MNAYTPLSAKDIADAERRFKQVVVPVLVAEHKADKKVEDRDGAVLEICGPDGKPLTHMPAGTAPADKFEAYHANATAKNKALDDNDSIDLSYEVHMGEVEEGPPYPGAIRTPTDDRFSISGFTWMRDTIGSLWLAWKAGRMNTVQAFSKAKSCGLAEDFKRLFFLFNKAEKELANAA